MYEQTRIRRNNHSADYQVFLTEFQNLQNELRHKAERWISHNNVAVFHNFATFFRPEIAVAVKRIYLLDFPVIFESNRPPVEVYRRRNELLQTVFFEIVYEIFDEIRQFPIVARAVYGFAGKFSNVVGKFGFDIFIRRVEFVVCRPGLIFSLCPAQVVLFAHLTSPHSANFSNPPSFSM